VVSFWLDDRGFGSRRGLGNFSLHHRLQTGSGVRLPIHWVLEALSLVVKQPGREADHSPPFSAEVNNAWGYTSTPPICLHGVALS
jgi:hypothetical protein